jgi:hypothetical protein
MVKLAFKGGFVAFADQESNSNIQTPKFKIRECKLAFRPVALVLMNVCTAAPLTAIERGTSFINHRMKVRMDPEMFVFVS